MKFFSSTMIRRDTTDQIAVITYRLNEKRFITVAAHNRIRHIMESTTYENAITRHAMVLDILCPAYTQNCLQKYIREGGKR